MDSVRYQYRRREIQLIEESQYAKAELLRCGRQLDGIKAKVMQGIDPSDTQIDSVRDNYLTCADNAEGVDKLAHYQARFIEAFTLPIVWSELVSLKPLSDREARCVSSELRLQDSHTKTLGIATDALKEYDGLTESETDESQEIDIAYIKGALGELTMLLLNRSCSAKGYAIPATYFDDAILPSRLARDGYVIDTRVNRKAAMNPYQVKGLETDRTVESFVVPKVNQRLTGNIRRSAYWPKDDREFVTVRKLIAESRGSTSPVGTSTLDEISSRVTNRVIKSEGKPPIHQRRVLDMLNT